MRPRLGKATWMQKRPSGGVGGGITNGPLIPRKVLFGNPERTSVQLSPDGTQISFLAPRDGVLNVHVGPVDDPSAARAVTRADRRGIRYFFWAFTNRHVLYTQDRDGDENWRVYAVDVESCEEHDLTPLEGVHAVIHQTSRHFPSDAGASYGGYATLVGLTFTPDTFACGIDIVGPSNLVTLLNNVPDYWIPLLPAMKERVGDPTTEEGRAFLESRSPLSYAERICRPLLIAQGANDPRVKQQESDQIVAAMQARGIPVTYAVYSDEGHGFARPENSISFFAVAELFLADTLGGRAEPVGDDFGGSTLEVRAGRESVPGLPDQ